MLDVFIGEIRLFGCDYAPCGWALCNGQSLQISQSSALFSVIGTTFGGDGKTCFNLPDLRGRVPMGAETGPGLTPRKLGVAVGADSVKLDLEHLPRHTHDLVAQDSAGLKDVSPEGAMLAQGCSPFGREETQPWNTYAPGSASMLMSNLAVSFVGNGLAHENRQPVQIMNYCIALEGIPPTRP